MRTQIQHGEQFRDLHTGSQTFLMPNAWDPGSACMLATGGFPCLATTSAGIAYSLGQPDFEGRVSRSQMMERIRLIAALAREIDGPINVVMGLTGCVYTVSQLSALGVKRISIGGSLARSALGLIRRAAQEMREHGSFSFAEQQIPDVELCSFFASLNKDAV